MSIISRRIKYLGFNDILFGLSGVVILSLIIDYLFNNSFVRLPLSKAMVNWGVSLFFSFINWIILTEILIALRKRFPSIENTLKRILLLLVFIVLTIVVVDIIGGVLLNIAFGGHYNPIQRSKLLVPIILISVMTMAIYEAIYFLIKLKKSIREEEQAKQTIVQAQLDSLRNQAQPHFFFNSLNTLRDIIEENPKAEAIDFVNKLADIYRFTLESGNSNRVILEEEFTFCKSYIHIQKERFGDHLMVKWKTEEHYLLKKVAPMSIQMLLENAIKHNVISKSKPLTIEITINDDYVRVSNTIQKKTSQTPSTKIGLENIKKRYALLTDRPVNVHNDGLNFSVSLPLL